MFLQSCRFCDTEDRQQFVQKIKSKKKTANPVLWKFIFCNVWCLVWSAMSFPEFCFSTESQTRNKNLSFLFQQSEKKQKKPGSGMYLADTKAIKTRIEMMANLCIFGLSFYFLNEEEKSPP